MEIMSSLPQIRQRSPSPKNNNGNEEHFETHQLSPQFSEQIARIALATFHRECKKFLEPQQQNLSSVYAAFVLETISSKHEKNKNCNNSFQTISFGLGTHAVGSLSEGADSNFCLKDLHAEILARKGLVSFLLSEAASQQVKKAPKKEDDVTNQEEEDNENRLFDICETGKFRFRDASFKIHLFVTQTPCGEASVFPGARHGARCFREVEKNNNEDVNQKNSTLPHEEKNLLEHACCKKEDSSSLAISCHCNGVDDDQEYKTRLKPGKGIRSTSMSCSDKISKWIEVGLVGAAAGNVLSNVIQVSSIVVLVDSKEEEDATFQRMKRAFISRHSENSASSIKLGCVQIERPFPRTGGQTLNSSSVCVVGAILPNPNGLLLVKQLTGKEGALQGSNAKVREKALEKARSNDQVVSSQEHPFCRLGQMRIILKLLSKNNDNGDDDDADPKRKRVSSYRELKEMNVGYSKRKNEFHSKSPFNEWVHDKESKKKEESIWL